MRCQLVLLYLATAVLVCSQSPPKESFPRPGEAKSYSAQSNQSKNQSHTPKTNSTQPVSAQNPVESPTHKGPHDEPAPENKQQTAVDIRSVPRLLVKPVKDLADWGYWVFGLLLVVVGSLQAWLLYRGWQAANRNADAARENAVAAERNAKATEQNAAAAKANADAAKASADAAIQQMSIMEKSLQTARDATAIAKESADAAKTSAEAFMTRERGWVLIEKTDAPSVEDSSRLPGSGLQIPYFAYHLSVYGNTPCKILNAGMRFHLAPVKEQESPPEPELPEEPDYSGGVNVTGKCADIPDRGLVLPPGKGFEMRMVLESGALSREDLSMVLDYRKFLCAYGFATYRDAFGQQHDTRFCYILRYSARYTDPSRFRTGGPPAYNRET